LGFHPIKLDNSFISKLISFTSAVKGAAELQLATISFEKKTFKYFHYYVLKSG